MYVKNVIPALGGVDCVCLVFRMLDNEFRSSVDQLHEKLELIAFSSVKNVVVLAIKMDDVRWDKVAYKRSMLIVKDLLRKYCMYKRF